MDYLNRTEEMDAEGRLMVPAETRKELGFKAGDTFAVAKRPGLIQFQKTGESLHVRPQDAVSELFYFVNGLNDTSPNEIRDFVQLATVEEHPCLQRNLYTLICSMIRSWAAASYFDLRSRDVIMECQKICKAMDWVPERARRPEPFDPAAVGYAGLEYGCDDIEKAIQNMMTMTNLGGFIEQVPGNPLRQFHQVRSESSHDRADLYIEFDGQGFRLSVTHDPGFYQREE